MHLDKFMKERGFTDQKLAEELLCNPATVDAWKKGINFPRRPQLLKLCEVLKCSMDDLVGISKPPKDPVMRVAKRLYQDVTLGGEFNSTTLHQMATQFRHHAGGKTTRLEKWLRSIAETLYEVELLNNKVESSRYSDFSQLKLPFQ